MLVTAGALIGLVLSVWGVKAIRSVFLNLPRVDEVRLDWRAMLFTVAASLIATALFPSCESRAGAFVARINRAK